jgi:hypothetical protein
MLDEAAPQPGPVPPGHEWWTRGLHEWHVQALQAQDQLAQVQARERAWRVQMATLLTGLLPHLSGDPDDPQGPVRRAADAIDALCRSN